MPDKVNVPSPGLKQPSLTELTEQNKQLSNKLQAHVDARNYLWRVAMNETVLPLMRLEPIPAGNGEGAYDSQHSAVIDMNFLPQELVEQVLVMLVEHEEKMAFEVWASLATTAMTACKLIELVKKAREDELRNKEDEFPTKEPQQAPAEVPRSWPGKPNLPPTS